MYALMLKSDLGLDKQYGFTRQSEPKEFVANRLHLGRVHFFVTKCIDDVTHKDKYSVLP